MMTKWYADASHPNTVPLHPNLSIWLELMESKDVRTMDYPRTFEKSCCIHEVHVPSV